MKRVCTLTLLILLAGSPALAALKPQDKAPVFVLTDQSKKEQQFSKLIGSGESEKSRGVVLSFFASWCPPCREELPLLNAMVRELAGKGIRVVLIAVREDFERVGPLLKELKVDRPLVLTDPEGKVTEQYQVRYLPTTFFIGSDGTIKDVIFGEIADQAEVRRSVEKIMK